jgi:hypothetical protein
MEVYALREIRKQQRRPQELRSGRGAVLLRSRCTVNTASVTLATASVTASKARTAVKQKKGSVQEEVKAKVDVAAVLKKASATAFRGGVAGFAAGVIQVGSFMWMRTVMNYQARAAGFACSFPLGPILRADAVPLRRMPTAARW